MHKTIKVWYGRWGRVLMQGLRGAWGGGCMWIMSHGEECVSSFYTRADCGGSGAVEGLEGTADNPPCPLTMPRKRKRKKSQNQTRWQCTQTQQSNNRGTFFLAELPWWCSQCTLQWAQIQLSRFALHHKSESSSCPAGSDDIHSPCK